jgi:hypothetical protein
MRIAIAALLCAAASGASARPARAKAAPKGPPPVVRWAHAEASKAIYKGQCPVRLVFTGTIQAARPGEFTFAWKRSDGTLGPARTLQATRKGQAWRFHDEWELSDSLRGWAQVWIPSENRGSPAARFRVQCK